MIKSLKVCYMKHEMCFKFKKEKKSRRTHSLAFLFGWQLMFINRPPQEGALCHQSLFAH